jgi:membrane-bound serine protease (ClpP class)
LSTLHRPEPMGARSRFLRRTPFGILRRAALGVVALGLVAGIIPGLGAGSAHAAAPADRTIDVIQVDGLIDPPNAELIRDAVRAANRDRAQMLMIKFNSGGAVDVDPAPLARAIRRSRVPVVSWVGPSGAKARGLAAVLALESSVVAVSNGSSIGPIDPVMLDDPTVPVPPLRDGRDAGPILHRSLGGDAAAAQRVTEAPCTAPPGCATIGDLLVALDGEALPTAYGSVEVDTARVVNRGEDRRQEPEFDIRFRKLDLIGQAVHTLTSPSIAYFLLVVGLALIVFEFFTISIGLAGGTGAVALIGAFVGFSHLPVNAWALGLILLAGIGYAVDVQAGRAYSWTVIATILLVIGSVFLYGGSSRLDVYWWVIGVLVILTVVFFVGAMPVAVRSRFSTPTIGRESLVGEMGEAAVAVDPDGVILLRGARWRARTNRATPIAAGDPVRVVEVDGLVLEVEPETGAARDYRERRRPETT